MHTPREEYSRTAAFARPQTPPPPPRPPPPRPTLNSLPQECLTHICSLLTATHLACLSACSTRLRRVSNDDLLWFCLCLTDYGIDARQCLPAFPYSSVRSFYVGVLVKWGWTLGPWQANYPFFTGQLLAVRIDPDLRRIVGEKITATSAGGSPDADDDDAVNGPDPPSVLPFGTIPGVTMDTLSLQLERKPVFEVRFERRDLVYASMRDLWSQNMGACTRPRDEDEDEDMDMDSEPVRSDNLSAAASSSTMTTTVVRTEGPTVSAYDQEDVMSYSTCCGAKLNTPTLRTHVGSIQDAWSTFSNIEASLDHFPIFRPSPATGLWPYPESSRVLRTEGVLITMFDSNEPPLAFNRNEAEALASEKLAAAAAIAANVADPISRAPSARQQVPPGLLALSCRTKCHEYGVRTVTLRAPEGELRFRPGRFQTLWSKIRQPWLTRPSPPLLPPRMLVAPLEGIWAGTYGGHGIEFLLLRYEQAPGITASAASSCKPADDLDMVFYKVTGDVNVPRGEVSCRAKLHDGTGNPYVRVPLGPPQQVTTPGVGIGHDEDDPSYLHYEYQRVLFGSEVFFGTEFHCGCAAFPGVGTVAMTGYRSPTRIPNDVIVISETEVAVYWHDMRRVSRFVKVDL
ncbi:hypothetical protein HDU89_006569 [Geranomyces variabilis]|nr:hypothetical protein HDU89_006569 [Geranomyces variabilis]